MWNNKLIINKSKYEVKIISSNWNVVNDIS